MENFVRGAVLLLFAGISLARAEVVLIDPNEQAIYQYTSTTGPANRIFQDPYTVGIGYVPGNLYPVQNGIFQFDVSGLFGAEIYEAELQLDGVSGFGSGTISFYGFVSSGTIALSDAERRDVFLGTVTHDIDASIWITEFLAAAVENEHQYISIIGVQNEPGVYWNYLTRTGAIDLYDDPSRGNTLWVFIKCSRTRDFVADSRRFVHSGHCSETTRSSRPSATRSARASRREYLSLGKLGKSKSRPVNIDILALKTAHQPAPQRKANPEGVASGRSETGRNPFRVDTMRLSDPG